ncbi:DUF2304 domain-containing protein [uncultured Actinomyces sp.]|uniref:DUF2304 domain-containing protein n=1 Tax=uncultured Actinomyces sp. TaxID=249061 RepID=UPI00325F9AC3
MSAYLLIRVLLLLALAVIAWWLTRPVSSASSLAMRRIGIGALVAAAVVAILVPSLANRLAHVIGVDRGVNLIVYGLVVALIAQMVTAYRREARMEARVAALARALAGVRPPDEAVVSTGDHSPETRDPQQVEHAASPPHSPTNTTDNDMVTSDE